MFGKQKSQIHHVYLGDRRTTVSLDPTIAFFLELKLGKRPGTPEAKQVVRTWLQARLDDEDDPGRVLVSQRLKFEALLLLVDKKLAAQYGRWLDEEPDG